LKDKRNAADGAAFLNTAEPFANETLGKEAIKVLALTRAVGTMFD
jgi:hypothetical protein